MGGGQKLGRMENECLKGMGFPFKGDENALKLDRGGIDERTDKQTNGT